MLLPFPALLLILILAQGDDHDHDYDYDDDDGYTIDADNDHDDLKTPTSYNTPEEIRPANKQLNNNQTEKFNTILMIFTTLVILDKIIMFIISTDV